MIKFIIGSLFRQKLYGEKNLRNNILLGELWKVINNLSFGN